MINLDDSNAVIDAAKPFDKSYSEGRSIVMLAGNELVSFVRHMAEDQGVRSSAGRRASDCVKADRIAMLERDCAQLQAALELSQIQRKRERRLGQIPFDHAELRRGWRPEEVAIEALREIWNHYPGPTSLIAHEALDKLGLFKRGQIQLT